MKSWRILLLTHGAALPDGRRSSILKGEDHERSQSNDCVPGNNVESLAEANAMLSAVSEDARKASNTEDKRDLESLQGWLEENINSQLAGVK